MVYAGDSIAHFFQRFAYFRQNFEHTEYWLQFFDNGYLLFHCLPCSSNVCYGVQHLRAVGPGFVQR